MLKYDQSLGENLIEETFELITDTYKKACYVDLTLHATLTKGDISPFGIKLIKIVNIKNHLVLGGIYKQSLISSTYKESIIIV